MEASVKNPHLQKVIASLERTNERVARLADLTAEELNWKPAPGAWSIGQCLSHLITAHALYVDKLEKVISNGWSRNKIEKKRKFRPGWFGKWFIKKVGPEINGTVKSPKYFLPKDSVDKTIIGEFLRQQDQIIALVRKADGLNLNKNRIASPVTKFLRFKLGDGFSVIEVHEERHLNQAERVLALQKESKPV
ncbi:MAG: DinB family protein [Bacteroidia bacterium]